LLRDAARQFLSADPAPHAIAHDVPFTIDGAGGAITFQPLPLIHGDIISLGYRVGGIGYCSDVSDIPGDTAAQLRISTCWSSTRCSTSRMRAICRSVKALEWIERLAPRRAILTHMHIPLDYDTVARETPDHVEPGYDGMVVEFDVQMTEMVRK
jgi:phosphoribosyl 1,2-cyclic phosphate phosphodiesterase